MSDTTKGVVIPAGWTYLFDLVEAQRVTNAQPPLRFPHARRLIFLATAGAVSLCRDPKGDPVGTAVSTVAADPTIYESGSRLNNESLRTFYAKGGGTLQVECEY